MKVSGFTFIRNAVLYDYPVVESISSILTLCDEFIVAVGKSDDNTRELIASMTSPKIKIIDTVWDESIKEGGAVLAEETNKALEAISSESTWAFYIQADEVIHEQYLQRLIMDMEKYKGDVGVEGLLLDFVHFYGSYDYIGASRNWYRKEVRVIRNDRQIRSYRDAQGFRKNGRPLIVQPVEATVYHYGWVKPPEFQQAKQQYFNTLWHDEKWIAEHIAPGETFDYSRIDALDKFTGTHPLVMKNRIEQKNWHFSFDPSGKRLSLVKRFLHFIEQTTGWRPGEYRNYRIM